LNHAARAAYHLPVLVELNDVRKNYGPVEALRGLTGTIDGECIGLLGPNGAGKSTLLRLLLGLTAYQGEVRVLGLSPRRDAAAIRDRVGYMPETESYLAGMNAVEMCVYAGQLSGLPRSQAMQRAHAALYYANLEDKRYLKVETYSTGMKQRVKLAQALVHDPELLFLDEPTNGLDPAGRDEMLELIAELPRKRGLAVVLSSHLLPDVERVCQRVVVMHEGRLSFVGSIADLRGGDARRFEVRVKEGEVRLAERLRAAGCEVEPLEHGLAVRLPAAGGEGAVDTDIVFRCALESQTQVRHLAPLRATLEAAFLRALETGTAGAAGASNRGAA
jgi:ABC-2 type transport system ATP-binding protein